MWRNISWKVYPHFPTTKEKVEGRHFIQVHDNSFDLLICSTFVIRVILFGFLNFILFEIFEYA